MKKHPSTGSAGPVAQVMHRLSLTASALAELMGVHVTTIYRWLAAEGRMDPLSRRIIAHLAAHSLALAPAAREAWGLEIQEALLLGGTLRGLAVALKPLLPCRAAGGR